MAQSEFIVLYKYHFFKAQIYLTVTDFIMIDLYDSLFVLDNVS